MCPYFIRGYTASLPQGWLHNALHSWQSSRCFTALVDRSTIISAMFNLEVWGLPSTTGIKQFQPTPFIHQSPLLCSRSLSLSFIFMATSQGLV
ncbi:hypothetical protein SCLCIDRAFT_911775 [Scleroderma citrinum Foug A]|uniref:Uncharacterized protein n=1 Tax=Scleroderma citrinum Foug A TaxID=1036808 RepID=A0A0C3A8Q0_9AGAM|nr:hypothetical protein SCLCIDRAFT_911775 [Scleroderma citrinum Foug A]